MLVQNERSSEPVSSRAGSRVTGVEVSATDRGIYEPEAISTTERPVDDQLADLECLTENVSRQSRKTQLMYHVGG